MAISKRNSSPGVPFKSCFLLRMFCVFLKCGNDISLNRLPNYTGCHSTRELLGPIDYFTNLGGGRDGIFLIIRHSNVMFSLEVTPPIHVIVKNIKCVLFYFRIMGFALLPSQRPRRNTVQNCRKINVWKLSMEKKTSWVSCRLLLKTVVRMLPRVSFTVLSHVPLLFLMYPIWIKQTMCHKP